LCIDKYENDQTCIYFYFRTEGLIDKFQLPSEPPSHQPRSHVVLTVGQDPHLELGRKRRMKMIRKMLTNAPVILVNELQIVKNVLELVYFTFLKYTIFIIFDNI
jgi:hypothetical protein